MKAVFLLPPIQGIPTGGNRYNEALLRRLDASVWRRVVWGTPEADAPWPADAVVLVDSLLTVDPGVWAMLQKRIGSRSTALLAHYLAACDPAAPAFGAPVPRCDRYIAPSRFMRDGLVRCGVEPARIAVAYPGLERPPPPPARAFSGPVRVLTVASQLPVKGLLEAVDALAPLSNRDWQWDIVGDDALDRAYSRRLADAVAASPLRGRIRLLGPLPPEAMPDRYAAADLLLAPSRFESLGMAIREAMASGLPVIAFAVGGVPESVATGESGLLAPAGDLPALAEATRRLLDDPALRRRLGEGARAASRAFPGWDAAADVVQRHLAI
ncbi:MAG: glycosyltransferase family 4 protein [Rhodothermales bacterium]